MKRSTLTLSILTALLVSACGGSSSNDEQTKDPTPPKVTPTTPTNPSTPSTGKTPTTGNKDNAGSSGSSAGSSSSSSSDPTPPISSGSAPSGGKPIVVNPPKTDEHTDDGDEDEENKKKDKDDKDTPQDLAQLEKEIGQLSAQVSAQTTEVANLASNRTTKFKAQKDAIEALLVRLGIAKTAQNGAGLATARVLLDKGTNCTAGGTTCEQDYQAAKIAQDKLLTAKENENKAQEKLEELTTEKNKKAQKLEIEKAKAGLKTAEIPVETEYYKAQETLANAEFDNAEAELKEKKLTAEKGRLDRDAGFFEDQVKDLTAAIAAAPKEKQAALTAQKTALEAKAKDLRNKSADIQTKLNTLSGDKKNTAAAVNAAKETITELDKSFGNRGVAGVTNYSAENLLEVVKAEKEDNKPWVITFKDATDKPVEIETTAMTQNLKFSTGNDVIAQFGKLGEDRAAFAKGKANDEKSIYGYVGNKFYSVGTVAPAPEVEKITDLSPIKYNGHALLKAKQQDMVAKFVGYANFGKKSFTGNFSNFENYSPVTASGQNETKATTLAAGSPLAKPVQFNSTIEGNKFKTLDKDKGDETANVYGYFYGKDNDGKPAEVGGLVEYNEMFHGSFGGEKQ